MNQNIENLDKDNLIETFKRLKRNTRGFSDLIVRDPLDFLDFEVELDSKLIYSLLLPLKSVSMKGWLQY